jgi:hypothetical protein
MIDPRGEVRCQILTNRCQHGSEYAAIDRFASHRQNFFSFWAFLCRPGDNPVLRVVAPFFGDHAIAHRNTSLMNRVRITRLQRVPPG